MSTRRLVQDLNHATSVLLLFAVVAAVVSGFLVDVWDLNDVVWHRWSGYAMAGLAAAHVAFNADRLSSYWRVRSRQLVRRWGRGRSRTSGSAGPTRQGRSAQAGGVPPGGQARRESVTRRVLLTAGATTVGALGGWAVARRSAAVADPVGTDAGMVYHRLSRPGVADALDAVVNWGDRPAPPKSYPDAAVVVLPEVVSPEVVSPGSVSPEAAVVVPPDVPPEAYPTAALAAVVAARRSVRDYGDRLLSLDELSRLLATTAGRSGRDRRTMPSAGALYPIELYAIVHGVDGLARGLYHYDSSRHLLHVVEQRDLRDRVVREGFGQSFLGAAGVVLCLTVVPDRARFRYRHRSYRFSLLEAGHMGQNAYLAATAMGLGACAVGSFFDDGLNSLLGVDGRAEAAVYLLSVGAR